MSPEMTEAVARLQRALDALDGAVSRHFDVDARRSDLETELGVMQEDRVRLATELEAATGRLARVESASDHVQARVGRAIASIREVLAHADALPATPAFRQG